MRTWASSAPNGSSSSSTAGIRGERPRKGDPLALAARELRRVTVPIGLELHQGEQLVDLGLGGLAGRLADGQAERDVVAHVHVLEQRVALEHESHAACLHRDVGEVAIAEEDAAAVRALEPRDDAQDGRLARARGAEQRGDSALGRSERDRRDGRRPAGREPLRQGLDGDPCRARRAYVDGVERAPGRIGSRRRRRRRSFQRAHRPRLRSESGAAAPAAATERAASCS